MLRLTFDDPVEFRPGFALASRRRRVALDVREVRPCGTPTRPPSSSAIFILTQVLDGALTYWGVNKFGMAVESNTWLASLMEAMGPAPALLAAKALAVGCGVILFSTTSFRVLAVATGWCLGFAVVPWLALVAAFGHV